MLFFETFEAEYRLLSPGLKIGRSLVMTPVCAMMAAIELNWIKLAARSPWRNQSYRIGFFLHPMIRRVPMDSPLLKKLVQFSDFSEDDKCLINELTSERQKRYGARQDIIREGEHSKDIHVVLSGLACRYKLLEDGSRQIMAFLVPGDPCDSEIFILDAMDHNIGTLAPSVVASISGTRMKELLLNRPSIALAFWWNTLQDEGVLRERIIDEGRRDAYSRIGFLIYEIFVRMRAFGDIVDQKFEFPITQVDLADATGLTPVHVNRMLKQLREQNLIAIDGTTWTVLDPIGLRKAAQYEASYLHLDRAKREPASEAGRRVNGLI
ncbi:MULTISPECIES: Crp/Fnr family transcriptional regulator [unclassified Mesorhizobium]|uniref:Crp/Fnr family transcriptional regulator n=1 Tax=unclassified Mesorhizobium TaxID=325217 RepID=UPI0015E28269|nr:MULTISPECIES: Crp/Fnr family transcriptional regulator [unclassified Mesorhizobium]MBZ9894292.1 Crp/Fnr family transcriptional regulator [Mesorhizobium sp. BR1-1-6]